jgi:hypothetical protein
LEEEKRLRGRGDTVATLFVEVAETRKGCVGVRVLYYDVRTR